MVTQGGSPRLFGAVSLRFIAGLFAFAALATLVVLTVPADARKCKGRKCDHNIHHPTPGVGGGSGDDVILNAPWPKGKKFIIGGKCGDFEGQGHHEDSGQPYEDDDLAIDIGYCGPVDEGTKILAASPGEVILAEEHPNYGKTILIESPDGMVVRYAHLKSMRVEEGQEVAAGEWIGNLGHTGAGARSKYNAHLHLAVYGGPNPGSGERIDYLAGVGPLHDVDEIKSETLEVPDGTPPFTPQVTGQSPPPDATDPGESFGRIHVDETDHIPVSFTVDFPNSGGFNQSVHVLRPLNPDTAQRWFGSSADITGTPVDADTAVFNIPDLHKPGNAGVGDRDTITFKIVKKGAILGDDQLALNYAQVNVKVVAPPDLTDPTVGVPTQTMVGNQLTRSSDMAPGMPTTFTWTAADNVGVDHYEYTFIDNTTQPTQEIEAGSSPSCTPTQCSVTRTLVQGHVIKLTVKAFDAAGNSSVAQSGTTFAVGIRDDTGNPPPANLSGTWAYPGQFDDSGSCTVECWGGSRRETVYSASRTVTFNDFEAFQVGLIGVKADGDATAGQTVFGKADVSFDSGAATSVNWSHDGGTLWRQVMIERKFSTVGSQIHDMTLTTTSPFSKRVNIDAVVMFTLYP